MKPHKHAEIIKQWADGEEIEVMSASGWVSVGPSPSFADYNEYRVKPAEPEKIYPETLLTGSQLAAIFEDSSDTIHRARPMRAVANAALRHACDNGQIVTREEFDRAVGDRKARDMQMAIAGARAMYNAIYSLPGRRAYHDIALDYSSIVEGIKP